MIEVTLSDHGKSDELVDLGQASIATEGGGAGAPEGVTIINGLD